MLGEDSIGKVTETLILDNCNRQRRSVEGKILPLFQDLGGGINRAEITEFLRFSQISSTKEKGKEL